MGAAASINSSDDLALLTAEELGSKVAELNEEFAIYKDGFITKNIDGKAIASMSKEDQIQTLKDIGVESESHQDLLIAAFEKLKVSPVSEKATNCAFVFIKPHANTPQTQALVEEAFKGKSINIIAQGELTAEEIDAGMLIDQHYYAIASKATLMKPKDLPVPAEKFEAEFGLSWASALEQGVVYNALDASAFLGMDADTLEKAFQNGQKVKFGGGFYCGKVEAEEKPAIYVFNAFFMSMRAKFVTPGTSIHYYNVNFDPAVVSWSDFRDKVLGPTDPSAAPADSLRGKIFSGWESLGLKYIPNLGDNGVHASASPFEGLAERMNWLKVSPENDPFGSRLIAAGVSLETIKEWSVDPQVKGKSLFDQMEDTNSDDCIAKAVELASVA